MSVVIICRGMPGSAVIGGRVPVDYYLKSYDPEAFGGRGDTTWTTDVRKAKRYDSAADAFAEYKRVPSNRPTREDGKPNRPLSAFTVEITPL